MPRRIIHKTNYLRTCGLTILFLILSSDSFSQFGFCTPLFSGKDSKTLSMKWRMEIQALIPIGVPLKIKGLKQKPILLFQPAIKWTWYNFKDNLIVERRNSFTSFSPDTDPTHIYKNKLFRTSSLMQQTSFYLPINIVFRPKNAKYFRFAPGFYIEYLIDGKFKRKYNDDSSQSLTNEFTDNDFYGLKRFQYGPCGHISYRFVTIYGLYALTPLFLKNQGPNLRKYNIGIWFNFFWKRHYLKPY